MKTKNVIKVDNSNNNQKFQNLKIMYVKKCEVKPEPEPPPPPDPCTLYKRKQRERAGIKLCPKEVVDDEPEPECEDGICIDRIKNPQVSSVMETPVCRPARVRPDQPKPCNLAERFNRDPKP